MSQTGDIRVSPQKLKDEPESYPPPMIFAINMFAMYIAIFCVALDYTIITTAIPKITDQFHALDDVGWYGSAYSLTQCTFLLQFGKLYSLFSPKWTFLASLFVFEIGSLISAVAPTSLALIIGRAIGGAGAAGLFAGVFVITTHTSPLEKRPIWQSLTSGMFGIASVIAPLIGGAFTDHLTWRWCFYINLPIGGVTAAIIFFYLHLARQPSPFQGKTLLEMVLLFDPVGFILLLPGMICLFLALQWGGTTYGWNDGRIIALLIVFGMALFAFTILQWWLGESATIPPRIITQRTIFTASWFSLFISGAFFVFTFFLPIYFQAIKGVTALQSGIHNLPLILTNAIFAIISGFAVSWLGYINPFCYASVLFASVGSGMLMIMTPETGAVKWIGYQILFGIGSGLGFQQPPIAPQAVLPFKDLPKGIALTLFFRNFGASVFVSASNNILNDGLLSGLKAQALSGVDPAAVLGAGATSFRSIVPASALDAVVATYDEALQKTFRLGLILSCLAVFGAVGIEWKSIIGKKSLPAVNSSENGVVDKEHEVSSINMK